METGRLELTLVLAAVAVAVTAGILVGVGPGDETGTGATTAEPAPGDTVDPSVTGPRTATDPDGDGTSGDVDRDGSASVTDDRAWRGTFGASRYDRLRGVASTPDGGVALAGRSERPTGPDDDYQERAWLVVTDPSGDVALDRTYAPLEWRGGSRAVDAAAVNGSAGGATGDGYLLLGHSYRTVPYSWQGWLVRLDADGDRVWTTNLTGPGEELFVSEMAQTAEGTLVLGQAFGVDPAESRLWLIGGDGDVVWNWTFEPTPGYGAVDLATTPEGFVVAYGNGQLAAVGHDGTTRWTHDVSDVTPSPEAVVPAPDGDGVVVLAGNVSAAVAVDSSGERRWSRRYDVPLPDGPYPPDEQPRFELVEAFPDGDGLLLAGTVDLPGLLNQRPTVVRVGPDSLEWRVGYHESHIARVWDAARTPDGGVAFAGDSRWYDGAAARVLPVSADGQPAPADWDDDGAAEDVTGEGATTIADVRALADRLGLEGVSGLDGTSPTFPEPGTVDDERAQELAPTFDFTGDGRVDARDVRRLYESLGVQYEAVSVDTFGDSPVVEGGIEGSPEQAEPSLTVITRRSGLDRINQSRLGPPGKHLLDETDFDSSYLVVYQTYHGTGRPDYTVREATLANGTLSVTVTAGEPQGPGQDSLETLFVRVSLLDRPRPDRVDVYRYASSPRGGNATDRTATTAVPSGE